MIVYKTNSDGRYACSAWGPTSWFNKVDCSVTAKAGINVKVVVSEDGLNKFLTER